MGYNSVADNTALSSFI